MELKKELGLNVKKYRRLNNLTQEQLAEKIGVDVISISSIETGRYFPAPENIVKLADNLGISISDLFDFKKKTCCEDYFNEINQDLNLVKNDLAKLTAISSYIKTLI